MTQDTKEAGGGAVEVAIEVGDGWRRRLTITVGPERVEQARAAERSRLAKRLRLKGFRKGKVPSGILEKRYGDAIDERVRGSLVEEAYREAIRQQSLRPAGAATISNVQYAPGERLTFQAEVEIMPSVELKRVGGFKLEREVQPVRDEELAGILEGIRAEHATWTSVDREPRSDDRVSVRIQPVASGEEETAQESKPYRFVLGGGQALPEVEKAIMTLRPGTEGTFLVDFPSGDEGEGAAKAEPRRLRIELSEVEERVLPDLDDALAREAGSFESLDELRQAVRKDLERHHEEAAERALRESLIDSVLEANPFAVPESLVARYLDEMIHAPEDADPKEVKNARESLAPHAERQIKEQLVMDTLIARESLQATAEEVQARVEELASRSGTSAQELRRRLVREGRLETIGQNLASEKVFDYLKRQSNLD